MSDTTTVMVRRRVKDELERIRQELDLKSLTDVIEVLLAERKRDSELDRVWLEIDALKKEIALLRQQQGGAGEGDPTRE